MCTVAKLGLRWTRSKAPLPVITGCAVTFLTLLLVVREAPAATAAQMPSAAAVGERQAPVESGVYLRSAVVADSLGASLSFYDISLDSRLSSAKTTRRIVYLRTALQVARSTVALENRSATVVGNLRAELWFCDGAPRRVTVGRWAWFAGVSVPVAPLVGGEGRVFEQHPAVTVPGIATWTGINWTRRGDRLVLMAQITLGYNSSQFGTSYVIAGFNGAIAYRITPTLSLPIGIVATGVTAITFPSLVVGLRWRPHRRVELSVGSYLRGDNLLSDTVLGDNLLGEASTDTAATGKQSRPLLRPTADLRVSF